MKKTPWEALDAMVPALVAHNLARAEVRAALREEVAAAVAELSTQTVGELLDELGLRAAVGRGACAPTGCRWRALSAVIRVFHSYVR